jgi:hypothetical protein
MAIIAMSFCFCAQIGGKQRAQLRRNLEQPAVEQVGGRILDRRDAREARAHQHDIVGGQHHDLLASKLQSLPGADLFLRSRYCAAPTRNDGR